MAVAVFTCVYIAAFEASSTGHDSLVKLGGGWVKILGKQGLLERLLGFVGVIR
jgi:hypothetical protein